MTDAESTLLVVHLAVTAGMTGLIWFVQLVHYPLFAAVGADHFVAYEEAHQRRTAWVVGPLMGVEGVSALAVIVLLRDEVGLVLPLAGLALLAMVHASTVFLQVPAHVELTTGYDSGVQRRLVRTNWVRTIGWSLRVVVASTMVISSS